MNVDIRTPADIAQDLPNVTVDFPSWSMPSLWTMRQPDGFYLVLFAHRGDMDEFLGKMAACGYSRHPGNVLTMLNKRVQAAFAGNGAERQRGCRFQAAWVDRRVFLGDRGQEWADLLVMTVSRNTL